MTLKKWYAVYVRSRNEKIVYTRLNDQGIESYLPLLKTLRQWHDRKRFVELPLFNSYVFVKTDPPKFSFIQSVIGVVGFVKFEGAPVAIPEEQINNLQLLLSTSEKFEVSLDEFELGDNVEVYRGALKGFKGILVEYKGQKRALLRIEAINQSLLVEIHPSNLKKQNSKKSG